MCSVAGIQLLYSTSPQAMTWNTADPIVDKGGFASAAQTRRLTIPHDGVYRISYQVTTNGVAAQGSLLKKNGADFAPVTGGDGAVGASGAAANLKGNVVVALVAGDYIEVQLQATSAPAANYWLASSNFAIELIA